VCVLDPDRGANLATKTVNDLLPSMTPNNKTTLLLTILVEEGGTSGLNHQCSDSRRGVSKSGIQGGHV
jgi:hypothetical protein